MKIPPKSEDPVAEHVEARERDVARADHQRHEVVAERGGERHPHEEHHRGAVHGEELVVASGREHRAVGLRELEPHEERLDAADDEEDQRGRAVEDRDLLVVDRGEPAPHAGRRTRAIQDRPLRRLDQRVGVFDGGHVTNTPGASWGRWTCRTAGSARCCAPGPLSSPWRRNWASNPGADPPACGRARRRPTA